MAANNYGLESLIPQLGSISLEDLYQKALGRSKEQIDPEGLEFWQKEIGPTAEGDEITRFLSSPGAKAELAQSGYTPFKPEVQQAATNDLYEYLYNPAHGQTLEEFKTEYAKAPGSTGAFDEYWNKLNKKASAFGTDASDMDIQDLQRYAKPNTKEFMDATGLDFHTAGELLYGAVGSNQDTRDWARIMASSNPAAAAREGLKQMYGGYGLKVSPPGYTADPRDDFDRQRTYLTDAQGRLLTHIGDYDPITGTSKIGANKRAALAFGADIPSLAQKYGMKIDVPEFEGQKEISYSALEKLLRLLAPPPKPKIPGKT